MSLITKKQCVRLDDADPLAVMRQQFALADGLVYLDGNSLGARPNKALQRSQELIEKEWGEKLIGSWLDAGWFELTQTVGDKLAGLIGAGQGEVVITDSTGINLYKCVSAALGLRPQRKVIVMEGDNFPTNNYMIQGLIKQLGKGHEIRFVDKGSLYQAMDQDVAVACLTHVHYKTGQLLDMAAINEHAHAQGALTVWDLCHSAGAMPVALNQADTDFAVGCTYKYLNGGPGSPAFIYMAERHHDRAQQPLTGWWGHEQPFSFARDYRPVSGIKQMLSGTQAIVNMALAEVGIDIFLQTDMTAVREKSVALSSLFIELLEQELTAFPLPLASPRDASQRGSQVSIAHANAAEIMQALISKNVVGDFRAPDIMRFGFTPLYTRYVDVWEAIQVLREVMENGLWQKKQFSQRRVVT